MLRRTLLLVFCLALATAVAGAEDQAKSVTLTINYGDGVEKRFSAIGYTDGMTIADMLDAAAKHPRGIKYQHRGSEATALLTQIDDLKNGTDDRYWIYDVNGRQGDRSYAIVKLKAGDSVLWRFDRYK